MAIDHKPENGCEIQNAACARSGVIIWLKLVKGKVEDDLAQAATEDENGLTHGTKVCTGGSISLSLFDKMGYFNQLSEFF